MFSSFPLFSSEKEHPVMCCVIRMFCCICRTVAPKYGGSTLRTSKEVFRTSLHQTMTIFFSRFPVFGCLRRVICLPTPTKRLKCSDWCYPTVYWPFPYLFHLNFSGHCLWWALTSRSINILISERMCALIKMYLTQARSLSCLVCHSSQSQRNGTKPA